MVPSAPPSVVPPTSRNQARGTHASTGRLHSFLPNFLTPPALPSLAVFAGYLLVTLFVAAPSLVQKHWTIGPEQALDRDRFYGFGEPAARSYGDPSPMMLDYPHDLAAARAFHAVPPTGWNPLVAAGIPLASDQGGMFFPLHLPFYLFPRPWTFSFFRFSRLLLAGIGAYLLARSRGLGRWASFVGGGLFELSGALMWMLPFGGVSAGFVAPWLIVGVNMLFRPTRGLLAIAVTGASIGLVGLAGHPGVGAAVIIAGLAAFIGASLEHVTRPRAIRRALFLGAVGGVVGALIGAASLLPFMELLAIGHSYKSTGAGPALWHENIVLTRGTWWLGAFAPALVDALREKYARYPYTLSSVSGLLTELLALVACFRRRVDARLGLIAVAGIILSFVPPGFSWTTKLPGGQQILAPYCSVMLALPMTQWAASGLSFLASLRSRIVVQTRDAHGERAEHGIPTQAVVLVCSAVVLIALALTSFGLMDDALRNEVIKSFAPRNGDYFGVPYLVLFLVLATCVAGGRKHPAVVGALVGVAALVELGVYDLAHVADPVSRSLRSGRPAAVTELARMARESHSRISSTDIWLGTPQYNLIDEVPDIRITAALVPTRYDDYMRLVSGEGATFYAPQVSSSPLLDIASVRYVLLPAETSVPTMPRIATSGTVGVFVNENAYPRARLVRRAVVVPGQAEAMAWLQQAGARGPHASSTPLGDQAVVEKVPGTPMPALLEDGQNGGSPGTGDVGTVTFTVDTPDRVELTVQAKAPALLTLADTYYPGWHASIDGSRTTIFPANLLFRGVFVPAGSHTVTFSYRSAWLWLGFALSLLGTAAVVAAVVIDGKRRRVPQNPSPSVQP